MKSFTPQLGISLYMRNYAVLLGFLLFTASGFAQLGWVQVPSISPGTEHSTVRGISGTSSSDVWAVGYYSDVQPQPTVFRDLLMHWNGSSWQQSPPLNLSTSLNDLWDVEAVSSNNVWAVGNYHDITSQSELLHFDGTAWTNQPLPAITGGSLLRAIHAVSPTDIWAVGNKAGGTQMPPYVIRYNGSSWTEITAPNPMYRTLFNDIHGQANDLWAVGNKGVIFGDYHSVAMHWNGTNWTEVSLPSAITTPLTEIRSVKMIATNDVWAMGIFLTGGTFTIHWDGSAWSVTSSTAGAGVLGVGLAAPSSNNVFAFSNQIAHWNGTAWSTTDPLTQHTDPWLRSSVIFSNGEIWAGGQAFDVAENKYVTLIYRTVNNTPQFSGGSTQSWNVVTNSSNNSLGNRLLTADPDVSQILSYSVVTAPLHGSLSGLPATAITNNGSALPTGVNYTPAAGYSGADQFVVRVSVGPVNMETTINVSVSGVLPVVLTDFNVTKQGTAALLNWSTASESNTLKFEIEHSTDGINFSTVANIPARGNSNTVVNYQFTHNSAKPGINYYRLKLVDIDGKITVFPIKSVQFNAATLQPVIVLSNPVKNSSVSLQVNITGVLQVNIYNMQGQKLYGAAFKNTSEGSRHFINLPTAKPGMYVLEVFDGREKYSFKLLME